MACDHGDSFAGPPATAATPTGTARFDLDIFGGKDLGRMIEPTAQSAR
jgi:hypothetical protein